MKKIKAYTDGSSLGNPGPGGYGCVLIFIDCNNVEHKRELFKGFKLTTNSRMEIMGVLAVLEALNQPCEVTITSDSKYVVDAIEKQWLDSWIKKGWKKADNKPVLNRDLWERVAREMLQHNLHMVWVRGHAGHPMNERCDELARCAASGADLAIDEGYIR